ncbi:MAG: alpha/beta hydrolase [Gemmatimonadaceae bacterium]
MTCFTRSQCKRLLAKGGLLALFALGCTPAHSVYIPRDPELQREPLYFYPAVPRSSHPKAGVFFLGNDLGFWEPHQKLAERLASDGYAVVGFDVKKFLDRLPDSALLRDSILVHDIPRLIKRSLHELGADSAPIVLAGHSFGADIALWTEANARPPGVVGVVALGPTKRDHPTVTLMDKMNSGEPTEPGSFAIDEQIRNSPKSVRIAVLRGASDKERTSDAAFIAAGGNRMTYTVIPFAAHSLKSLIIAGPMIEHEIDRMIVAGAGSAGSGRQSP